MRFCCRTIARITCLVIIMIGAAMAVPMFTAVYFGETSCARAFFRVLVPCAAAGIAGFLIAGHSGRSMRLRDGFLTVFLIWFTASVISAVPLVLSGSFSNMVDAFFEMCSGFSTTGASVVPDKEALPRSILLWRSMSQWIGGLGILIVSVAWVPSLGLSAQEASGQEPSGRVLPGVTPVMLSSSKGICLIYAGATVLQTVLMLSGGVGLFDSVTHSFSTVSTGGFSNYNDSFDSGYITVVVMIFMLFAGTGITLFTAAARRNRSGLKRDDEFRAYIKIFIIFSLIITALNLILGTFSGFGTSLREAAFQTASILTTTGFSTSDYTLWPSVCVMLLFLLYFTGGCSSSAAGGPKVVRVLVTLRMIRRTIGLRLHPSAYIQIKYNDKRLGTDTILDTCAFIFLYAFALLGGGILLSLDNFDMVTCISAAAACLSNVGPGIGLVGPAMDYAIFSTGAKLLLSFMMIAGRLELFTVLMLLSRRFWNPDE